MSVNNVNPGTYLTGTTWVAWGAGRVPVGVDTTQTEFDTVEETGGVVANTAQNASQAHTNLQPYITCYMWKRTT